MSAIALLRISIVHEVNLSVEAMERQDCLEDKPEHRPNLAWEIRLTDLMLACASTFPSTTTILC